MPDYCRTALSAVHLASIHLVEKDLVRDTGLWLGLPRHSITRSEHWLDKCHKRIGEKGVHKSEVATPIGIDAHRKRPEEAFGRESPSAIVLFFS